ncbi:hypothetical protein A6R68_06546 [Neotoma lepida]|uniref:Uncharacterized protein n=1 Tax=Neotoma lepida TaxID=56216 RepID=A0A1A6GGL1_NEOLE|nr:hypothetical protein A6R68_06546 [Neotoma lepida]
MGTVSQEEGHRRTESRTKGIIGARTALDHTAIWGTKLPTLRFFPIRWDEALSDRQKYQGARMGR